jgi:type VI secretion system secreted protein VgrG
MPRPGLQELASLSRDNILMEGKSQHSGSLDLSPEEKRRLALEFVRTPDQLCLLYPGQCVALAEYFQQHWSTEQRLAFMGTGEAAIAQPEPSRSSLLFDWLVNGPDTQR